MSKKHKDSEKGRKALAGKTDARGEPQQRPEGPHARPDLTDPDKTPGAGSLPDPGGKDVLPGTG